MLKGWQALVLKRDINLKLIFVILILILAIVSFSTFYQNKFKNISENYNDKAKQLEKITAKAVSEESKAEE